MILCASETPNTASEERNISPNIVFDNKLTS